MALICLISARLKREMGLLRANEVLQQPLFSFFPHNSELRPAIRIIFHALFRLNLEAEIAKLLKKAMPN